MQSRRSDRKAVSFPASVSVGGRTVRDVVSNVSPTGLYLEADRHRFRSGERVRISFSLPVSGKLIPVTVEGRVARIVRDTLHRTRGIGVELLSPPSTALQTIDAYLAAREGSAILKQPQPPSRVPSSEDARLAAEPRGSYQLDEDEDEETTDPDGEPSGA